MTRIGTSMLVALAALLAACIPEFANPVGTGDPADRALAGKWIAATTEEPDDRMLLEIVTDGAGVTVVMRDPDEGADKPISLAGRTGVGPKGTRFVSLKPVGDADLGGPVGHFVFRYETEGEKIKVWGMSDEALAAAVAAGKIAGTVTGSGSDTSIKIAASGEEAAAFLESPEGQGIWLSEAGDILYLTKAP